MTADRAALVEKVQLMLLDAKFGSHNQPSFEVATTITSLIRAEVLEEAAKAVEAEWGSFHDADVGDILKIIRALKEKT